MRNTYGTRRGDEGAVIGKVRMMILFVSSTIDILPTYRNKISNYRMTTWNPSP